MTDRRGVLSHCRHRFLSYAGALIRVAGRAELRWNHRVDHYGVCYTTLGVSHPVSFTQQ